MTNNHPAFVPFPVQLQSASQGQPSAPMLGNESPARVRMALEFLTNLTVKRMTRAAANDISIEIINGQQSGIDELRTETAALEMLADYFRGELKPDQRWEGRFLKNSERESIRWKDDTAGTIIRCPICQDRGGQCNLCNGRGALLVQPTDRKG